MRSLIFIAALLLAGPQTGGFGMGGNPRPDNNYAFFEFAPANGKGMGNVCGGTTPTGARGEALTFTRATTATCTKTSTGGLATTGIANGDLVSVSSGQPRVEYDANGVLGLLVEEARTNVNVRSEEIDNAAYADTTAGGAAAPTLNGTCGTSPLAAAGSAPEDYTFPATTATQLSIRRATAAVGCSGAACTYSFYVKGVSGSGTMDVCAWDTSTPVCAACAFVDTSWTRCTLTSTRSGVVGLGIGNGSLYNGGTARSSNRVCVTGAQVEVGAYVTSYIPTTNAAVARNREDVSFAGISWPTSASISMAGSAYGPTPTSGGAQAFGEFTALASLVNESGGTMRWYTGAAAQNVAIASTTSGLRWYAYHDGSTRGFVWGANSVGPTASASAANRFGATYYPSGVYGGGTPSNCIVSRICVDPSPTRCR